MFTDFNFAKIWNHLDRPSLATFACSTVSWLWVKTQLLRMGHIQRYIHTHLWGGGGREDIPHTQKRVYDHLFLLAIFLTLPANHICISLSSALPSNYPFFLLVPDAQSERPINYRAQIPTSTPHTVFVTQVPTSNWQSITGSTPQSPLLLLAATMTTRKANRRWPHSISSTVQKTQHQSVTEAGSDYGKEHGHIYYRRSWS